MSTTPNDWLGNLYGTVPSEQEKLAAAQQNAEEAELWNLFKAAAAEDGIDADALNDEQVRELSQQYIDDAGNADAEQEGSDLPPNWDGDDVDHFNSLDTEAEKTAFVQFKEADLVGKIMAHSMFSEMDKLAAAKEAMQSPAGSGLRSSYYGALGAINPASSGVDSTVGQKLQAAGRAIKGNKARAAGVGVAGLGALAAGRAIGKKVLSKKEEATKEAQAQMIASAIDNEGMERARNILKEAGIDPDTGEAMAQEPEGEFDLTQITEEDADQLADQRAEEILKEAGYQLQ